VTEGVDKDQCKAYTAVAVGESFMFILCKLNIISVLSNPAVGITGCYLSESKSFFFTLASSSMLSICLCPILMGNQPSLTADLL
jgi:hypothetical protein